MMWIIYDVNTLRIVEKHYSKAAAKEKVALYERRKTWKKYSMSIDRVDLMKLDKWLLWRTLTK